MTNLWHSTSCEYDGDDLQQSDLSIDLVITRGLKEVAEVRGTDTVIPGAVGRRARNRVKDKLDIELAGWIQGVGDDEGDRLASFRATVEYLKDLFSPDRSPAALTATLEDGSAASVLARPLTLTWGEEKPAGVCQLSVSLESVVPDWSIGS